MSDLPEQGLLQQLSAKPVSGEHLELLGKRASALWSSGKAENLSQAVVETVKHAGLSPEQVRRVIEFTNSDAYLREFKKEGSEHKYIDFPGGPADPSTILQDLNDGGGGSVFDDGLGHYAAPPKEKKASFEHDLLEQAFSTSGQEYPDANPLQEAESLRYKVAGAIEFLNSDISSLELDLHEVADKVYFQVKQAALQGHSLSDVIQVMSKVEPSTDQVKAAFAYITPRLLSDGVFPSEEKLAASFQKTASARLVNTSHPLIPAFGEFCGTIMKLAECREAKQDLSDSHTTLTTFLLKEANKATMVGKALEGAAQAAAPAASSAKGWIPTVTGATKSWGASAKPLVSDAVKTLTGSDAWGGLAGGAAEKAIKYAPHAAALVGANEVRRELKYSPTYNRAVGMINPVSDAYRMREAEIAARYGRYPE